MKAVQLASAGLLLLCCCCQILAGLANMNLQSSDSALIVWLKCGIWSSGWLGPLCSSHSSQKPAWVDLDFSEVGNGLLVSGTAMKNVLYFIFLTAQFQFSRCFLNLIHAVTSDKHPVLILSCVPSWTLWSQMCCHGAELLLPSQLLISVRSPPRLK